MKEKDKKEEAVKGSVNNSNQPKQINPYDMTYVQSLDVLDQLTEVGLKKRNGMIAVIAIEKLKEALLELNKCKKGGDSTEFECNANHPCWNPATGQCICN